MLDIQQTDSGWQVLYCGKPIGEPKPTQEAAEAYKQRLAARYPRDVARFVTGIKRTRRAGTYRWSLPDGRTGTLQARSKAEAQRFLRREFERQRLPAGLTLELTS